MQHYYYPLFVSFLFSLASRSARAFLDLRVAPRTCPKCYSSLQDDEQDHFTRIVKSEETPTDLATIDALTQQADALRAEAESMKAALQVQAEQKLQKELAKVDGWIEHLLVRQKIDENTEILNSVDEITARLRDGRFSQEQVNKVFDRICETSAQQSRSNCSPHLAMFVDAVGKLDCVEREDNPNKRWNGRVERDLRRRLFAMDWCINLERDDE